jgi:cell division protein FtsZ
VVATGLGRAESSRVARAEPQREAMAASRELPSIRVVKSRTPLSSSDYSALDRPTIQRQRAVGDGLRAEMPSEELLDIPAFLRRQAD